MDFKSGDRVKLKDGWKEGDWARFIGYQTDPVNHNRLWAFVFLRQPILGVFASGFGTTFRCDPEELELDEQCSIREIE